MLASDYSLRDVAGWLASADLRNRRQKKVWNPDSPLVAKSTVSRSQPSLAMLFMWRVKGSGSCALWWVQRYSMSAILARLARPLLGKAGTTVGRRLIFAL
jgi:hypothetical protein